MLLNWQVLLNIWTLSVASIGATSIKTGQLVSDSVTASSEQIAFEIYGDEMVVDGT